MSRDIPRSSNRDTEGNVAFSHEQLKYLEGLFPHVVHGPNSSEALMRQYFGQQDVMDAIRRKTRGTAYSIPTPG